MVAGEKTRRGATTERCQELQCRMLLMETFGPAAYVDPLRMWTAGRHSLTMTEPGIPSGLPFEGTSNHPGVQREPRWPALSGRLAAGYVDLCTCTTDWSLVGRRRLGGSSNNTSTCRHPIWLCHSMHRSVSMCVGHVRGNSTPVDPKGKCCLVLPSEKSLGTVLDFYTLGVVRSDRPP